MPSTWLLAVMCLMHWLARTTKSFLVRTSGASRMALNCWRRPTTVILPISASALLSTVVASPPWTVAALLSVTALKRCTSFIAVQRKRCHPMNTKSMRPWSSMLNLCIFSPSLRSSVKMGFMSAVSSLFATSWVIQMRVGAVVR